MDQLSGISNVMNSMPFVTGVMEPITVQSPSSAVDCIANAGYELVQNIPMEMSMVQSASKATVLPTAITVRATNPQLQQQKLLLQQQQQLIRQQQMLQQQYVQQQLLQNALWQAMQQVQCQTTTSRPFSSSPVIVSPSGIPASSGAYVAIQMSSNDQVMQSRPLSMTATTVTMPMTTATAVQPSLVQLGGVRMVPVAPFVANQLRSSQPTSVMSVSRPQQPIVQRPFILGQSGLVSGGTPLAQPVVMSTSVAGASTTQRPVLVSPSSHIPLTVSMTMIPNVQSFPIAQLAQVQQQSTRFIGSHCTTPQQVAYVSPVLPSLVTFGDNTTVSSGGFQIPADMSSVLTDTLKLSASLSPSLVGGQLINPQPSLAGFEATAPIHELSLTADGRLVSVVGKPMQHAYIQSMPTSATRVESMPAVSHDVSIAGVVLPSATVMPTYSSVTTVPLQPPTVVPTIISLPAAVVAPSTTTVSCSTTTKSNAATTGESMPLASTEKPITVLSSEPDRPDSCILTHIIEGFVIREGPVPFPVHKSFLNELPVSEDDDTDNTGEGHSSDFDSSDQDDNSQSTLPTPKSDKVTISETPCEFCGKTGFEVRFGRPHRFCSLACSSKQHVALTKPGIRHLSSEKSDLLTTRRKSNNMESTAVGIELMQGVEDVTVERANYTTIRQSVDEREHYPINRQSVDEREIYPSNRQSIDERECYTSLRQKVEDRDPCSSIRQSIDERERYHSNRPSIEERDYYPSIRQSVEEREPCSSVRPSIEDRERCPSNRQSMEEMEHYSSIRQSVEERELYASGYAAIRQSVDDKERYPSQHQPLEFVAAQPIVQRSPSFRHESPSKSFQSPPHQPSALAVRGLSDLHISEWGVQEVCDFVRSLPGCSMYADEFRRQEIDGQALMLLTEDHMMTTLNMKLGPALKICQHIRALRDN